MHLLLPEIECAYHLYDLHFHLTSHSIELRDDFQTKQQKDGAQLRLKVEPKLDAQMVGYLS